MLKVSTKNFEIEFWGGKNQAYKQFDKEYYLLNIQKFNGIKFIKQYTKYIMAETIDNYKMVFLSALEMEKYIEFLINEPKIIDAKDTLYRFFNRFLGGEI